MSSGSDRKWALQKENLYEKYPFVLTLYLFLIARNGAATVTHPC